ncbi:SDR family oxidoreductase [Caulobacter vibrioides]|uniref:Triphenylmethane reductase (TMR)-like protein n=1 Tax=Caulobacter vibrioides (strain NA1000 / CB15N) TaxID=565050 RepID=A0A0H3CDD8_CAUVN|nr:SDR family oxidoreductase [Caulobacter vibrioides]YP_002518853.1 triphenylmethane reductase (TMR)-like protein [Caulobacter vibrioides NA1000]ACL96945.1 triphenylmethane reductase (TMR)-like protein [Caulobacter vibrioides NA1000]ATC30192.1 SDR family NAD(P)-dependent oxidoreductase [Caulobacter vibrioides]QXZ51719.1 SDR family oxidoreductase [Caulobacter vibrioides]
MTIIAITGATGQLGRLVIEKLKARASAETLVALVRDPAKAADLGVPARAADYDKPETLTAALAGVDVLLLISSDAIGQRIPQHRNVIEAAKAAGVKRIAYTSLLHADTTPIGLGAEHHATEAMIRESGLAYTLLRNSWYLENYAGAIAGALHAGAFVGSAGEGRISAATRADYADAAAVVLTSEGHAGKTYELAGDEAFTMADLAAEASRQTGRTLPYNNLPEAAYAKVLESIGLPPPAAAMLAQSDVGAAQGGLFDDGRQLSRLIGRPTTPWTAFVAGVLESL